ncbi:hypothetical protein [Bifidobacterium aerophilum]|nr:hypothetical protein [Bifidobacterium aerophilum]
MNGRTRTQYDRLATPGNLQILSNRLRSRNAFSVGQSIKNVYYAQISDYHVVNDEMIQVDFDAVNAYSTAFWPTSNSSFPFAIHPENSNSLRELLYPDLILERVNNYWNRVFTENDSDRNSPNSIFNEVNDPFHYLKLCTISLTLQADRYENIVKVASQRQNVDAWFTIILGSVVEQNTIALNNGTMALLNFGWSNPQQSNINTYHYFTGITICPPKEAAALNAATNVTAWPAGNDAIIRKTLQKIPRMEQLICFNVGQGTCVGLADAHGKVLLYSDLGCDAPRNQKATPKDLQFCNCTNPPIILSHWHCDHYNGIFHSGEDFRSNTWILPPRPTSLNFNKSRVGKELRSRGGTILNFPNPAPTNHAITASFGNGTQVISLIQCTGKLSQKNANECGIAVEIEDMHDDRPVKWILPGDASYSSFTDPFPDAEPVAVVAAHHGGHIDKAKYPHRPSISQYARLLFSFGTDNTYGIPCTADADTLKRYKAEKWRFPSGWVSSQKTYSLTANKGKSTKPKTVIASTQVKTPASEHDVLSTATWKQPDPKQPQKPLTHIAASWKANAQVDSTHLKTCLTKQTFQILR